MEVLIYHGRSSSASLHNQPTEVDAIFTGTANLLQQAYIFVLLRLCVAPQVIRHRCGG